MFRPTAALGMRYAGIGLDKLMADAGAGFGNTVEAASKAIEKRLPIAAEAKIQGTRPHHSSRDPADTKEVITVSYHDDNGTRLLSIHAHNDGTWNEFLSRAGRSKSQSQSGAETTASGERGEDGSSTA
ncbi:hypothetical protein ACJ73_06630 [Blastomyces percursus]|uniref:Uncharacterized protein n=1 Tax=Blastomyces percursus TaxID=1658174 RepID=A0A1J9QPB1_9EURO|nr:hypothetical protein ACJ73_06630 [Blastomyces percursus]